MSANFDVAREYLEKRKLEVAVIVAAKLVHKRVTSKYRTQRCVLALKDAVKALEEFAG